MKTAALLTALAIGLLAMPPQSGAEPPARRVRIGYLGGSSPALEPDLVEAFRQGLRDLGYVEGRHFVIEYRWAEGRYERFPDLVADLIRRRVDCIVTEGTPGALAAKEGTRTIPIVMAVSGDPVEAGLVASLARPGGNITGSTTIVQELEGKRLELLGEAVPKLSRVVVLGNPDNPITETVWRQTKAAAVLLHVGLQPLVEVRSVDQFEEAFAAIARARPRALAVIADRFLLAHRARIVEFAARRRLPAMYPFREFVDAGGLMSYSPSYTDLFRRAAGFVDRILNGAKPGDLPVEEPQKYEFVVNLKTAKALGLAMPRSLLFRADRVIQ